MKRLRLIFLILLGATTAGAQDLPETIVNAVELYKSNGGVDKLLLSKGSTAAVPTENVKKIKEFWGVNEDAKNEFTIEFWYKNDGTAGGQQEFIAPTGVGGDTFRLRVNPKNGMFIYINNVHYGLVDFPGANGPAPCIPREEWHHYAFTYKTGTVKFFLDGEQVPEFDFQRLYTERVAAGGNSADVIAQLATEAPAKPIFDLTSNMNVRQNEPILKPSTSNVSYLVGHAQTFNMALADVRVWNAALTASVIAQWKDKYVNSDHTKYAKLQHNWKMNEVYEEGDIRTFPDRGALNTTLEIETTDMAKYPTFLDEDGLTILAPPSSLQQAKANDAVFAVDNQAKIITISASELEGTKRINIFNSTGQLIYMAFETANAGTLTVNAPQGAGIYYVQVVGNNNMVGKVVIK